MKKLLRQVVLLPRSSILFAFVSVLLLALSIVQVDCPIVGNLVKNPVAASENLKVLEIKGELIDYRIQHAWCANAFVTGNFKVYISVANEGPEELRAPLLIEGVMPEEMLQVYASGRGKASKLLRLRIPGNEIIHIQEEMQLWAAGLTVGEKVISKAEFSVITNPAKIIASCSICGGEGRVPFFEALKAQVR